MAYIPQYVPTDTNVLQNTLNQYQQAYDANTAKFEGMAENMASVPTSSANDEAAKNSILTKFAGDVDNLDKQFNYDRSNSQYAQRLAALTTRYRGNPFWGLVSDKAKIADERQKLQVQLGNNYYENVNPLSASYDPTTGKVDRTALDNWKPQNLQELYQGMGAYGAEHARTHTSTDYKDVIINGRKIPGVAEVAINSGFGSVPEAYNYANTKGRDAIIKQAKDLGFDATNPVIFGHAAAGFASTSVGKPDISHLSYNPKYDDGDGNTKHPYEQVPWGTPGVQDPLGIRSASDISRLKKETDDLNTQISKASKGSDTSVLQRQLNEKQLVLDRAKASIDDIVNDPKYAKIKQVGIDVINRNLSTVPGIKIDANSLFDNYKDFFLTSPPSEKPALGYSWNEVNPLNIFKGKNNAGTPAGQNQNITNAIYNKYLVDNKTGDYINANATKESEGVIKQQIADAVAKTTTELYDYFGNTGNYHNNNSFAPVMDEINTKIKNGDVAQAQETAPSPFVKDEVLKVPLKFVINGLVNNKFDAYSDKGKAIDANSKDYKAFLTSLHSSTKEGDAEANASLSFIHEPGMGPTIVIHSPTGKAMMVRINPDKLGRPTLGSGEKDIIQNFVDATGMEDFKDIYYKDLRLPDRTQGYTANDYPLKDFLMNHYGTNDLSPFKGITIHTKITGGRTEYYANINGASEPTKTYANKRQLFDDLFDPIVARVIASRENNTQ